jgi:hypothetical protein
MSEQERLNNMSKKELLEFARFAYTAYPTLLETHEKRTAFFRDYPHKNPYRTPACPYQMELPFEEEVDEKE